MDLGVHNSLEMSQVYCRKWLLLSTSLWDCNTILASCFNLTATACDLIRIMDSSSHKKLLFVNF